MTRPRPPYQRLFDWEYVAIINAYSRGEKIAAIATEFDIDPTRVSRIAIRAGLPRRSLQRIRSRMDFRTLRKVLSEQRQRNVMERNP